MNDIVASYLRLDDIHQNMKSHDKNHEDHQDKNQTKLNIILAHTKKRVSFKPVNIEHIVEGKFMMISILELCEQPGNL